MSRRPDSKAFCNRSMGQGYMSPIIPDQPCNAAAAVFAPPRPSATITGMGTFSLRRLLASVTLFAVGLAIVVAATHDRWPEDAVASALLWMMAGASFGAAVFMPFKLARTGAIFGALLGLQWALGPGSFKALE